MPVAHTAKGSALYATISASLTKVPGVKSLKVSPGENETFENADLDSGYRAPVFAGIKSEGTFSGQLIWDPLGAEQQFLQAAFNSGATVVGKIVHGPSGVETSCNYIVTKFEPNHELGDGMMADIEGKFTSAFVLNESDPS